MRVCVCVCYSMVLDCVLHRIHIVAMPGSPVPRTKTFEITSNENSELLGRSWVIISKDKTVFLEMICKKLHIYSTQVVAVLTIRLLIFVDHIDGIFETRLRISSEFNDTVGEVEPALAAKVTQQMLESSSSKARKAE